MTNKMSFNDNKFLQIIKVSYTFEAKLALHFFPSGKIDGMCICWYQTCLDYQYCPDKGDQRQRDVFVSDKFLWTGKLIAWNEAADLAFRNKEGPLESLYEMLLLDLLNQVSVCWECDLNASEKKLARKKLKMISQRNLGWARRVLKFILSIFI